MNDKFIDYLDKVEKLKKAGEYDKAWRVSNEALMNLLAEGNDSWFMFYYQMADILDSEEKWFDALVKMGYCTHFIGRLGGLCHEKFILRLLKKFSKEQSLNKYLDIVLSENDLEKMEIRLKEFINN